MRTEAVVEEVDTTTVTKYLKYSVFVNSNVLQDKLILLRSLCIPYHFLYCVNRLFLSELGSVYGRVGATFVL